MWLIFLEVVVTRCFGWAFNFDYRITAAAVLWVLGWSMIVLAGAVWLPMRVLTGVALLTIVGHSLLASIQGMRPPWLWSILYGRGNIEFAPGHNFYVAYTVIPWFAVMMAGFSLGQVFRWEAARRRRFLVRAGVAAMFLFAVVRGINGYGDPAPWAAQKTALFDVFSFVNCTKYPPSLDFLLMTLGPAMVLLGVTECVEFRRLLPVVIFGRVPLFYYVVHIPVMHLIAVAISYEKFGSVYWFFRSASIADFPSMRPPGWGYGLGGVYLIWIAVLFIMYPLCRWYEGVKRRSRGGWLSYL